MPDVHIMIPGSLRTTTIWPRIGTTVLSSTPPSFEARRPEQLMMISALLPEAWKEEASEMWERIARLIVQPCCRHWPTRYERYMGVLMQTVVQDMPDVIPGGRDD